LTFDVIRPEHASCRSSVIHHRSRMHQAFEAGDGDGSGSGVGEGGGGDGGAGNSGGGGGGGSEALRYLWRAFSLSLLSNLG